MAGKDLRRVFAVGNPRQVVQLSAAHGVNEFYSIALPPILPLLIADFDITYAQAGLLVTVYFVMYTLFQLPAGFLADRVGKRPLISAGMVVLAAGMLVASAAQSYALLLVAQVIAGIGGSTYHPAGMSLISDIESGATEGRAMGLHAFGGIAGTLLAPVFVGGLAAVFDWRTALATSAGVGVVYALAFALLFEPPPGDDGRGERPAADGHGGAEMDSGSAVERLRRRARAAFRVPVAAWVVGLVLAKLLFSLEFSAVRTFTTSYVFSLSGESTTLANGVFFVLLAGGALASLWFGSLADRFDRRRLVGRTFVLAGVAFVATTLVPPRPLALVAWFFVLGVAAYASLPVINTLVSQHSRPEFSGSLFGVTQTASALGSALSPLVFGVVATEFGIATAFPAVAVVCFAAGIVFLLVAGRVFD